MMYKNYKSVTNDEIIRYLIISKDIPKALKFVKENYSKMEYQFKAKIYFTLYYKFDKQNELQKYKKRLENMGFPKNEIEMFLAYYYLENKNSEDDNRSVEILNNLIDKGYANDDVYLYLFNYYIKNDNYDKIKQLYIAKRDDFEDNSLGVKILYSLIKENYSQSADFFDIIRWEKMENKYVFSFFYGLIEMKRYKKADNLIERIDTKIIKENNLFDYYFLKVQIKSNSNDYKGMKKNFELANKIDPDNADLLNYYGYSLLLMNKDYEKALKYLKKAYEISPKNAAINDSLGWAYFKLEQVEKAVRYINFSLNKIPNDPEVLYHKARIEEYYGRYSNSLMYLKKRKQNEDKKIEYIDFDKEINRIKNIINNNSN